MQHKAASLYNAAGTPPNATHAHRRDPESIPDNSPTLYKSDRGSWVVQGWVVTDPEALAALHVPAGETVVEIPDRRWFWV
ncbi:MAG: hypothetical protein QOH50_3178 [Kribbellaceae bacterium]|nr:hypothetical protein [Kribbellaceae bacterium]